MQSVKLYLLFLLAVFLVVGCTSKNASDSDPQATNNSNNAKENAVEIDDEAFTSTDSMSEFFLPNGTKAHYKGEGIEFAQLDVDVTILENEYAIVDEDNGGVTIRTIYLIQKDTIEILSNEPVDLKEPIPTIEQISNLEPKEIYLQKPFEIGATFEDWSIIEIDATVETPFKNFHDAIVIEMEDENFINRKYLVPGYGEVKRVSIIKAAENEENEEFIVTSTLESIK